MQPVILFRADPCDRAALDRLVKRVGATICLASDCQRMATLLERLPRAIVVVNLDRLADSEASAIVDIVAMHEASPIFHLSLSSSAAKLVASTADVVSPVAVCLKGFDGLERCVLNAELAAVDSAAGVAILAQLKGALGLDRFELVWSAALVGRRVTSVREWGIVFGQSTRTLERRFLERGLPGPKRVLSWMLALHTAWRVERLGWTRKQAASVCGASSPRSLATRLVRGNNVGIGGHRHMESFGDLLERCAYELGRPGGASRSEN